MWVHGKPLDSEYIHVMNTIEIYAFELRIETISVQMILAVLNVSWLSLSLSRFGSSSTPDCKGHLHRNPKH